MSRCKKRQRSRRGWRSLPGDLLQLIADKLPAFEDFVALTCVSRYFRSSLKKDQWRPLEVSRPPGLLLGSQYNHCANNSKWIALSMYKKNKHHMNLPELHQTQCFGTRYGWIITLDLDLQLHLFNPLNRARIALPPPTSDVIIDTNIYERRFWMRLMFIQRAILIKRPPFGFHDFLVVASGAYGALSVLRPQKNTWETMNLNIDSSGAVHDVAYYKGHIYVVCRNGTIFIFSNVDGPGPLVKVECVPDNDKQLNVAKKLYLLESSGDLLLVGRCQYLKTNKTCGFLVFKYNPLTKKWAEVNKLGDRSLFVGDSESISLSSPKTFNCRRNCIYFTDDSSSNITNISSSHIDFGRFNLKRRTIRYLFEGDSSLARLSSTTWFIPAFS